MGELAIPGESELVPIEGAGKALEGVVSTEEMFDGEAFALPIIKVVHQGGLFRFPDEQTVSSFQGVVLLAPRANVYWEKPPDDTGELRPPDCASDDAIHPNPGIIDPVAESCAKCPYNIFGSNPKGGGGKACRNIRRAVVLCQSAAVPYLIGIPATSLKAWKKYLTNLAALGIRHQAVVLTELGLESVKRGAHEWSLFTFKVVGALPLDTAKKMFALSKRMRSVLMNVSVGAEGLGGAKNEDFEEEPDEDVPF